MSLKGSNFNWLCLPLVQLRQWSVSDSNGKGLISANIICLPSASHSKLLYGSVCVLSTDVSYPEKATNSSRALCISHILWTVNICTAPVRGGALLPGIDQKCPRENRAINPRISNSKAHVLPLVPLCFIPYLYLEMGSKFDALELDPPVLLLVSGLSGTIEVYNNPCPFSDKRTSPCSLLAVFWGCPDCLSQIQLSSNLGVQFCP